MKRITSFLTGIAFVLALLVVSASAQEAAKAKVVNGGILNGKAVSLPKPVYPEAARLTGAQGAIAVDIVIDEAGTVISAQADLYDQRGQFDSDGNKLDPLPADPSLREAAENAAREARFSPTLLGGQPVHVKGRIVYNFVADKGDSSPAPSAAPIMVKSSDAPGINGGVLNGKAIELPAPAYPAAARAVRAEGAVAVQVLVGENGNIIDAAAVSGHPLLRAAAESAAREAKFSPTFLSGQPVKFSGVLTYNFVLPKKDDQ